MVRVGVNPAFRGGSRARMPAGRSGWAPPGLAPAPGSTEFPRCPPAFVVPSRSPAWSAGLWRHWHRFFPLRVTPGRLVFLPSASPGVVVPLPTDGFAASALRGSRPWVPCGQGRSVSTSPSRGLGFVPRSLLLHVDACGERG